MEHCGHEGPCCFELLITRRSAWRAIHHQAGFVHGQTAGLGGRW
jgi:hypothetical protein